MTNYTYAQIVKFTYAHDYVPVFGQVVKDSERFPAPIIVDMNNNNCQVSKSLAEMATVAVGCLKEKYYDQLIKWRAPGREDDTIEEFQLCYGTACRRIEGEPKRIRNASAEHAWKCPNCRYTYHGPGFPCCGPVYCLKCSGGDKNWWIPAVDDFFE